MGRYEDEKLKYQKPLVEVVKVQTQDVITASPTKTGEMEWGEWGDFDASRDNTWW